MLKSETGRDKHIKNLGPAVHTDWGRSGLIDVLPVLQAALTEYLGESECCGLFEAQVQYDGWFIYVKQFIESYISVKPTICVSILNFL